MKIEAALTIAEGYEGEFLRRLHRDCAGEWSAAINGRSSMPALPHHEKGGQPRGAKLGQPHKSRAKLVSRRAKKQGRPGGAGTGLGTSSAQTLRTDRRYLIVDGIERILGSHLACLHVAVPDRPSIR